LFFLLYLQRHVIKRPANGNTQTLAAMFLEPLNMRNHKKIFYVSGMISLIFIPLIFLYYAIPTSNKMNLRVVDIGLPYKLKKGEKESDFKYAIIPTEGWNYKQITIQPNINLQNEKYYFELIKKLHKDNIDKTGLQFKFQDNSTYGDFVKIINLMNKAKQDTWGLDTEKTNSLYVVHFKLDPNENLLSNDTFSCVVYTNMNDYNSGNSSFIKKLIYYSPKQSIYLLFGYLMLLYCAMLKPKLRIEI